MKGIKLQHKIRIFNNVKIPILVFFWLISTRVHSGLITVDTNNISLAYSHSKLLYKRGEFKKAINELNRILEIKAGLNDDVEPKYFKVYNRLGLVHKKSGKLNLAIRYYKKALKQTNEPYYQAFVLLNIANIHALKGDYQPAILYNNKAISSLLSLDTHYPQLLADTYYNLGCVYDYAGESREGIRYYTLSLKVRKENGLPEDGDTYLSCGNLFVGEGELNNAENSFKHALNCYKRDNGENHYTTALAYLGYAGLMEKQNKFIQSLSMIRKSMQIFQQTLGEKHLYTSYCYSKIGKLYGWLGNYQLALEYHQQALISKVYDFNDSSEYSNPVVNQIIPDTYILDMLQNKALAFEQLATMQDKTKNRLAALDVLKIKVVLLDKLKNGYLYENSKLELAENEYKTYLTLIKIFHKLYEVTSDISYAEQAFLYTEKSKYSVSLGLKNEDYSRRLANIPDSLLNYEKELKEKIFIQRKQIEVLNKSESPNLSRIREINDEIFGLNRNLEQFYARIESEYDYNNRKNIQIIDIKTFQEKLPKNTVSVEYVLSDSLLYAFLIAENRFVFNKSAIDTNFHKQVEYFVQTTSMKRESDYDTLRQVSYGLYKKLLLPFESYIEGKNLLIIPDGQLSDMAFEALVDEPWSSDLVGDYTAEPFLINKYPIGYGLSATLYVNALGARAKYFPQFLGFAPDYDLSADSLTPLPNTISSLAKLPLLMHVKKNIGTAATEEAFKKTYQHYDIIHLYLHGSEDKLSPSMSRLFFHKQDSSIVSEEDSYLYAYEVNELEVNGQLLVLPSCHSGSGKISKGEGILSLGRSFVNAGSSSVIMSLWASVHDPVIQELEEFYKHLFRGKRKDKALQLAKLNYIKKSDAVFAHPKFWASPVLLGNPDPIYRKFVILKYIILITLIAISLFVSINYIRKLLRQWKN